MPKAGKTKLIVAYVPVIHRGYLEFFDHAADISAIYVIDKDLIAKTDYLRKDLRALQPKEALSFLKPLSVPVNLLGSKGIAALDKPGAQIIMPDEDISREVAKLFKRADITFMPVFLRWDRKSVDAPVDDNEPITQDEFHRRFMAKAVAASARSADIWRHVGACLLDKDGRELGVAVNKGEPSPHSPWMEGDPRNVFNRGVAIEMSVFTHAEADLIARAAKQGRSVDGGSLYVTTFPCPACAKLIANSGIKNLYYKDGYAILDGRRVLEDYGVKIVRVAMPEEPAGGSYAQVPYKSS